MGSASDVKEGDPPAAGARFRAKPRFDSQTTSSNPIQPIQTRTKSQTLCAPPLSLNPLRYPIPTASAVATHAKLAVKRNAS